MSLPKLLIICHTNLGSSLSGGDRIFLNFIKYWQKKFDITALASPEATKLIKTNHLHPRIISTTSLPTINALSTLNLIAHHSLRFLSGIFFCLTHLKLFRQSQYIYTSSDFYGDFVFGLIAKLANPHLIWLCGYYLLAPKPNNPSSPYVINHHPLRGLIYFIAQIPTTFIANRLADFVFVTSAPDALFFPCKSIIVQGGVDIPDPKNISQLKEPSTRTYDAFYLGRLHSQKGILEMIDIWHLVTRQLPLAKLVIVGDGELMGPMTDRIKELKLTKNIKIVGFLVGPKKFALIKNCKVVLHPATYDSGGMAAAEAMAWGLPGVAFNLPALKTYYPQGMLKVRCFDKLQFAQNIISLLQDKKLYQSLSTQAVNLTRSQWGWKKKTSFIYQQLLDPKAL